MSRFLEDINGVFYYPILDANVYLFPQQKINAEKLMNSTYLYNVI